MHAWLRTDLAPERMQSLLVAALQIKQPAKKAVKCRVTVLVRICVPTLRIDSAHQGTSLANPPVYARALARALISQLSVTDRHWHT